MTNLMILAMMAIAFHLTLRDGPKTVVRSLYVVVLFVAPVWMVKQFGTFNFDYRFAVIAGMLAALLFRPMTGSLRWQILLGDLCVMFIYLSEFVTTLYWDDTTITTPFETLRMWVLPYLMGRMLARSIEDLEVGAKVLWWVGIYLAVYAIIESVTKTNLINHLYGRVHWILDQEGGDRWGMKRAHGPLEHPIYFGMMLTMLWPWTVMAAPKFGKWGWVSPVLLPVGIFLTISRGAWFVGSLSLLSIVFFSRPRWRFWIGAFLVSAVGLLFFASDEIRTLVGMIIGEKPGFREYILIKGHLFEYTGTLHRGLLFDVYADALRDAGWLGYGAPDNMRVPYPPDTDDRFRSIDQAYIHLQIRLGMVGLIALLATGFVGLFYFVLTAWNAGGQLTILAAGLLGSCGGIMIILNTVSFQKDFSVPWIFSMGVATGLERLRRLNNEAKAVAMRIDPPTFGALRPLRR